MSSRPVLTVRLGPAGTGSIRLDDGGDLPVTKLRIEAELDQPTRVSFELIGVVLDLELPADQIFVTEKPA